MKKLFSSLIFSLIVSIGFGQLNYNANSIYFAGAAGTTVKDTVTFCSSNPCPVGTLIFGNGKTFYVKQTAGWKSINGSGGTPASPVNSVQFNNSGSFGGSSNFTWDNTNNILSVSGVKMYGKNVSSAIYGPAAGNNTFSGANNLGIGYNTLTSLTTGSGNIAVGSNALWQVTTGLNNLWLGQYNNTTAMTGSSNLVLGGTPSALNNITTGSNNLLIGLNVVAPSLTTNGQMVIGTNGNNFLTYDGSTSLGLNAPTGNKISLQYANVEQANITKHSTGGIDINTTGNNSVNIRSAATGGIEIGQNTVATPINIISTGQVTLSDDDAAPTAAVFASPNLAGISSSLKGSVQVDNTIGVTITQVPTSDAVYARGAATGIVPFGLIGSASLDFPSTAAGTSSELSITLSGTLAGDVVCLGSPNNVVSFDATILFTAYVSASNTVKVRMSHIGSGVAVDPPAGTFTVIVMR